MAGVKRKTKNKKNKKQREEKYNAENEIIIGVTKEMLIIEKGQAILKKVKIEKKN